MEAASNRDGFFFYKKMRYVHFFNPGHEMAVFKGHPSYTPPSNVHKMMKELELLPVWYASPNDYVLVEEAEKISKQSLPDAFRPFAKAVSVEEVLRNGASLPPATVNPWGESPHSLHMFSKLKKISGWDLQIPKWNPVCKTLCGRQTASDCLKMMQEILPEARNLKPPLFCTTLEEIYTAFSSFQFPVLCKMPYSSSGRGLLWLESEELAVAERNWINGAIKRQGSLSVEPALNKVSDFAMEFYSDGQGNVVFKGISCFTTEERGAYSGNRLDSQKALREELSAFIGSDLLDRTEQSATEVLKKIFGRQYTGFLGVDMLIYKDMDQNYQIHPCIEINMRYTMGMLAIHLYENFISERTTGYFAVTFHKKPGDAYRKHCEMMQKHPQLFEGNKLLSGYLPLCPVTECNHYIAYILATVTYS